LTGDGTTALVAFNEDWVVAYSADLANLLWKYQLPELNNTELQELLPAGRDHPATVVARVGNALIGLDGKSGKPRWKADGPGDPRLLLAPSDPAKPRVVFTFSGNYHATVCRQALPTSPAGRYR
jgi:hypothetical protein